MESIEKLRKAIAKGKSCTFPTASAYYKAVDEAVDGIEREIAERYMELPLDADGVPIHTGDMLKLGDTRSDVVALAYRPHDELPWEWLTRDGEWHSTAFARHVKPRTLEDVLRDLASGASCMGDGICRYFSDEELEPYAAEIRELLGVE